jgi:hypothetical protein
MNYVTAFKASPLLTFLKRVIFVIFSQRNRNEVGAGSHMISFITSASLFLWFPGCGLQVDMAAFIFKSCVCCHHNELQILRRMLHFLRKEDVTLTSVTYTNSLDWTAVHFHALDKSICSFQEQTPCLGTAFTSRMKHKNITPLRTAFKIMDGGNIVRHTIRKSWVLGDCAVFLNYLPKTTGYTLHQRETWEKQRLKAFSEQVLMNILVLGEASCSNIRRESML